MTMTVNTISKYSRLYIINSTITINTTTNTQITKNLIKNKKDTRYGHTQKHTPEISIIPLILLSIAHLFGFFFRKVDTCAKFGPVTVC